MAGGSSVCVFAIVAHSQAEIVDFQGCCRAFVFLRDVKTLAVVGYSIESSVRVLHCVKSVCGAFGETYVEG